MAAGRTAQRRPDRTLARVNGCPLGRDAGRGHLHRPRLCHGDGPGRPPHETHRPDHRLDPCGIQLGRHVPPDDQYFVMHRVPPIAETDDDGNLVNIRPAEITFTLLDKVRREYEAGENE